MNNVPDVADRQIVITRTVHASRELVWEAWTNPEHLIHWWGPNGFTNTFLNIDVRQGGEWNFIMHGQDGVDYPNLIVFNEIVEPERIVFTHSEGKNDPNAFQSMVTFEDLGDSTKVTLSNTFATQAERDRVIEEVGAIEGGNQTLGRLDDYVQKM